MSAPAIAAFDAQKGRVDDALAGFFDARADAASRLGTDFVRLWDHTRDATVGGKRVRPTLVLAAHADLGGVEHDAAVSVAVAFELLHTAFMLHDDVIDGDVLRRGQPNLVGTFRADAGTKSASPHAAASWGQTAAILAGDLLIPSAVSIVGRIATADRVRSRLLDLLDETIAVTASGELDDVALSIGVQPPTLTAALEMATRKTAHYTFQAPLRAGAILADADDRVLSALDRYGRHAGLAFQLRDDVLGVFGNPAQTGKSTDGDLVEGKVTPMMASALESELGAHVRDVLAEPADDPSRNDRLRELLERCGSRALTTGLIEWHIAAAVAALDTPGVPGSLRTFLAEMARDAGERTC